MHVGMHAATLQQHTVPGIQQQQKGVAAKVSSNRKHLSSPRILNLQRQNVKIDIVKMTTINIKYPQNERKMINEDMKNEKRALQRSCEKAL